MELVDLVKFEQLKASGDLPSPKGAALAIIRLTQKEDASAADLAHVVKADPAFVGRLIKAANSIRVSRNRPIASIQDALIILGIPAVRSMALGFSLISSFRSGNCRNFDFQRFWSRSLACAVALQTLVLRTHAAPPDEAFSIGLLARVGELALATIFPEEYSTLLEHFGARKETSIFELEQDAFVMTHGELTAAMLADWGLPKVFTEPVFFHEHPEDATFTEGTRPHALLWSLVLAGYIADICLAEDDARRSMMPQLMRLGSRMSIEADAIHALCDKVVQEWREWGEMLNVGTQAVPPFGELSKPPAPPQLTGGELTAGGDPGYRMRALVVDDDPAMRGVLVAMLASAGHEVFEASNGRQGFEMALDIRPQLVVVDWTLPEMDGIAMTRELRQTKLGRGIYVLILTSVENDEKLVQAFEAGVDDFMTKPLKPRILAARLRAGQRVVRLQQEIERDHEEMRHFAAELAVTNRRLQEAALTDALTGFPNRRYAMERIQQEWAGANRSKQALSCMVIDIDEFKKINDSFGHDVGDAVLRQTAAALKSGLRAHDVIARIGGDEFLVICPNSALSAAYTCAERVRLAVEKLIIEIGATQLRGSVSIGIAQRTPDMPGHDALIKEADRGVFLAKQGGRNLIRSLQRAR